MNIYNGFDEIPFNQNTILTLGTFDGVHLGHQYIIKKLIKIGSENMGSDDGRIYYLSYSDLNKLLDMSQ